MADTQEELTPIDVIVDNIKITSTNGKKEIDITDLVNAIDINEALFTPILTGVMLITDAAGLLTELPVLSQEKITFDITKPGSGERAFTKSCEFRVRQIDKIQRVNDITNVYQLRLVEESYYWNALQPVSQSFKGTIDTMMTEIAESYLRTTITTDPTSGLFQCVIPGWRPYETMQWLSGRARSERNDSFYLYTTFFDGMQLRSSRNLFEQDPVNEKTVFSHKQDIPKSSADAVRPDNPESIAESAFIFEVVKNTPTTQLALDGVYGKTYTLLDSFNKTYEELKWNFDERFSELPHLSKHKVLSDEIKYDGQTIPSYSTEEDVYVYSSSAFNSPSHMSYNQDTLNTVPFSTATDRTLGNFVYKFAVAGDKDIQVGKTINVQYNRNIELSDKDTKSRDDRRSGKHMIGAVKHRFQLIKNQYTQMIEVNRDTMDEDHEYEN